MRDGQVEALEKSRRQSAALERMLEIVVERIGNGCRVHIATAHANSDADAVALLAAASDRLGPVEAFVRALRPVVGAHIGPGTVALAYMTGVS